MELIKSDLVDVKYDAFWEDTPALTRLTPRPVLVLSNHCEQGGTEHVQLQKMMAACKLSPEQYNIVLLKETDRLAWHKLREAADPKIIFLIGISPVQLGISALFRMHEPNRFDGRMWLPAISLKEQEQHPEVKRPLWEDGMKPLFILKSYVAF